VPSPEETKEAFDQVKILLEAMIQDRAVPRNIKRVAQKGIDELSREDEDATDAILAANVIYLVDDLTMDANIPFHSRTTIYRIMSILEKIKD
jgi:uncharacterized protein (UPF0147 family)